MALLLSVAQQSEALKCMRPAEMLLPNQQEVPIVSRHFFVGAKADKLKIAGGKVVRKKIHDGAVEFIVKASVGAKALVFTLPHRKLGVYPINRLLQRPKRSLPKVESFQASTRWAWPNDSVAVEHIKFKGDGYMKVVLAGKSHYFHSKKLVMGRTPKCGRSTPVSGGKKVKIFSIGLWPSETAVSLGRYTSTANVPKNP